MNHTISESEFTVRGVTASVLALFQAQCDICSPAWYPKVGITYLNF